MVKVIVFHQVGKYETELETEAALSLMSRIREAVEKNSMLEDVPIQGGGLMIRGDSILAVRWYPIEDEIPVPS